MAESATATTGLEAALAQKPCSNCRNRKIACDRSLPTCTTCTRRKKVCSGYAVNLSWPRVGDKRRATVANVRGHTTPGAVAFLNTSTWDVGLYLEDTGTRPLDHPGIWRVPSPRPTLHTPQFGTEMTSTQYSAAMQMVTSQGDLRQDICSLLYRMSLNDETAPSLAVRHSMNAISYLHLRNSAKSIHHHMLAVSALRQTIGQMLDFNTRSQAIAASMLLSIYELVNRSSTARDWSIYFDGTLLIFESGQEPHVSHQGDGATLLDWVIYYNVFYKLSIAHWLHRTEEQEAIANRKIAIRQVTFHPRRQIIQSTLGCSLELLGLLSQAVDLVRDRKDAELPSQDQQKAIDKIQHRVELIDQQLCSGMDVEAYHGPGTIKHYIAIARIFQLSVIIYLDRVVRGSPVSSPISRNAAKEAFQILRGLGVCERPFPMFILSLQAEQDSERVMILEAMQNSKKKRALSNLDLTEQMVQRIWSQQDLHGGGSADALFVINAVFSALKTPTCLA